MKKTENFPTIASTKHNQDAIQRAESTQFSRRQALRRFGFTAGTALGMMAIGDIARFVQQQMEMTERTKTVADCLVSQFAKSDVAEAMATPGERCEHAAMTAYTICLDQGVLGTVVCYKQYTDALEVCRNTT